MLHERPLAHLPAYIAAARARGRPTRLVLRNTDRVGLVHLYFLRGGLILVEGHRGAGVASLADLATWQNGTIRQDDLDQPPAASEADPQLESALADALRQLEARSVVTRSTPPPSDPRSISDPSQPRLPAIRPSTPHAANIGLPGLPPLANRGIEEQHVSEAATALTPVPPIRRGGEAAMGEPQWQLLTRFVHEIVERARRDVAPEVAVGLLMQVVGRLSGSSLVIGGLEVDESGWLRPRQDGFLARSSLFDTTRAIAQVVTDYEARCAVLTGPAQARKIITDAAVPYRAPLAALGLDISPQ